MRASKDFYPFATNFSDLPDLVTDHDHAEGTNQKSFFKKLDKLNEIAQSMVYDEQIQVQIMMRKAIAPFKGPLKHFNGAGRGGLRPSGGSKPPGAKNLKLNLPVPDLLLNPPENREIDMVVDGTFTDNLIAQGLKKLNFV